MLLAKVLWGHMDGSEDVTPDASDDVQSEFQQKSQRAFSTIVMAMGTCMKPGTFYVDTKEKRWQISSI